MIVIAYAAVLLIAIMMIVASVRTPKGGRR